MASAETTPSFSLIPRTWHLMKGGLHDHSIRRTRNQLLQWLLDHGFDINSQTPDGRTVLHRCAAGNELEEVKALIALGANPDLAEHHYKATPLGFALHNRAWEVAHYLKDFSDDIFDVCRMAHVAGVERLLSRKPLLAAARTPMGNTPLHLVCQAMNGEIDPDDATGVIKLLLEHGADPTAKNKEGMTAEQWHRKTGNPEVAGLIALLT